MGVLGRALALAIVLATATPAHAGFGVWTSGGPPDELVTSIAVDPQVPAIVYAGTNGHGVFKTTTGGAGTFNNGWFPVNVGLTNPTVLSVAVHPIAHGIVYAGTSGGGVFLTFNGGVSWTPINAGLNNPIITALAIDPVTPSTIYAGTNGGGVFKSTNGGQTWAAAGNGLVPQISALVVNPSTPGTLYAGTPGSGVYKSVNGGQLWVPANTGLFNQVVTGLAINPQNPATLYVATNGGGVFRSLNAAASWTAVNTGLSNINLVMSAIAVDPTTPTNVYAAATGSGVFRSTNQGNSWAQFNTGLLNTIVPALAVTPAGTCVHAGTRGSGVFDFDFTGTGCAPVSLAASVLPSSRSVQVGATATAFATIINPAPFDVTNCGIGLASAIPASFLFQTTDPTTNALTGTVNTRVTIPANGGFQTFVIALTPNAPFGPTDVAFAFTCDNLTPPSTISGVNTLLMSASPVPVPDIVALAAANGGIVDITPLPGVGAFSVAVANVGAGGPITVSLDTNGIPLSLSLVVCRTNPSGACQSEILPTLTQQIDANATMTFGIFVGAPVPISPDAAGHRVFVRFSDQGGQVRGLTSVAVQAH